MPIHNSFPQLGFGLGLRPKHYPHIFEHQPSTSWFEIISENFMDTDGRPKRNLARMLERYPVVIHGVALSIGTVDPLNSEYLHKLKALIDFANPAWVSDHLCWTGIAHRNSHDLLPVPYTDEALKHIIARIKQVQDFLGRPIALENPSTYLEFNASHLSEAQFIAHMAEESGCHLLLDVNNVYVTCFNHRLDAKHYIDTLPLDRVIQIHLSGHSNRGTHIIDTHDDHVVDEVWQLYKYTVHRAGRVPNTMVEWDDNIPEFAVLEAELTKAKLAALDADHFLPLPDLAEPALAYSANTKNSLAQQQQRMFSAIVSSTDSAPDDWIKPKATFLPQAQLEVYANAYRWRLHDVVAEDYPVLKHYLGADAFHQLLDDFIAFEIPDHFNIGRFALKLAGFIHKALPKDPMAYELCQLETAIAQLADPAETPALELDDLQGMDAEALMQAVLCPREALQLFAFQNNVNAYYCAVQEGKATVDPVAVPSYVVAFRHDDTVWRMDLGEQEYRLLKLFFSGVPMQQALTQLQEHNAQSGDDLANAISHWFARWMRNGLIARVQIPAPSAALKLSQAF